MRALLTFIATIYLGGIGVDVLSKVQPRWHNATPIELFAVTWRELPHAAAWPVRAFQSVINRS
jgi:hypothetical protein